MSLDRGHVGHAGAVMIPDRCGLGKGRDAEGEKRKVRRERRGGKEEEDATQDSERPHPCLTVCYDHDTWLCEARNGVGKVIEMEEKTTTSGMSAAQSSRFPSGSCSAIGWGRLVDQKEKDL